MTAAVPERRGGARGSSEGVYGDGQSEVMPRIHARPLMSRRHALRSPFGCAG